MVFGLVSAACTEVGAQSDLVVNADASVGFAGEVDPSSCESNLRGATPEAFSLPELQAFPEEVMAVDCQAAVLNGGQCGNLAARYADAGAPTALYGWVDGDSCDGEVRCRERVGVFEIDYVNARLVQDHSGWNLALDHDIRKECRIIPRDGENEAVLAEDFRGYVRSPEFAAAVEARNLAIHDLCNQGVPRSICLSRLSGVRLAAEAMEFIEACLRYNTWDGLPDADDDEVPDVCDCVPPDEPEVERQCWQDDVPNPGGLPGQWQCEPGNGDRTCVPYEDVDGWMTQIVLGGGMASGPGLADDAAAAEVEFDFEDGIGVNCPPGVRCETSRSRQRGKDYERFLCKRLLRKSAGTVECLLHPNPARRVPSYRTEAFCWDLPPGLQHEMGRRICRDAGGVRFPDYLKRTVGLLVLGEGKCYEWLNVAWDPAEPYLWFRAASFGPQFESYIAKMVASRRGPGPRVSINYHFCGGVPGWARLIVGGYAADGGGNNFHLRIGDNGGHQFVTHPICFDVDPPAFAEHLYRCFEPEADADVAIIPQNHCVGSFYDLCSGSE